MLFNTPEYALFFLMALAVTWLLKNRINLRVITILLLSLYFYTTNNQWLIVLILVSTGVDYVAGLNISKTDDPRLRKRWLILSLGANLGILGFFKYFNFFSASLATLGASAGLVSGWVDYNILLPVGISFYTFQSMAYTIDVYRGNIQAETSLARFACYISYFPQLIAGPIVRPEEFLPQLRKKPTLDLAGLDKGLYLIFKGLTKKIIFSDFLAVYADAFFNAPGESGTLAAWLGVYCFSLQIYLDFSGYTDIAIGCARIMGFDLPRNFDSPYASLSFSEFWRKWHMTLSRWFRDYLYIPLGGSRTAVFRNLMITMTLCGLWHGAAWTFVAWGVLHGMLLCAERLLGWNRSDRLSPWRSIWMFQLITLTWIPFRAGSLSDMGTILNALFSWNPTETVTYGMGLAFMIVAGGWLVQLIRERINYDSLWLNTPILVRGAIYGGIWCAVMVFNSGGAQQFIYFQF